MSPIKVDYWYGVPRNCLDRKSIRRPASLILEDSCRMASNFSDVHLPKRMSSLSGVECFSIGNRNYSRLIHKKKEMVVNILI
jgi:hypothetical protein